MLEIQERLSGGYEKLREKYPDIHITEALDRGEAVGFIAYSYEGEYTAVYDYSCSDLMLCDGLVRSVMLKSCMKGIFAMHFELADKEKYAPLVKLRFLSEGSNVCKDLDSFMNACEHCSNK